MALWIALQMLCNHPGTGELNCYCLHATLDMQASWRHGFMAVTMGEGGESKS